MIQGKKNILDWFETDCKDCRYWILFDFHKTDSGNYRSRSSDDENATNKSAYDELARTLGRISNGRYTLVALAKGGNIPAKGKFQEDIELSYMDGTNNMPSMIGGVIPDGYIKADDVDAQIKKALRNYQQEQELTAMKQRLTELEKENKELTKAVDDPINKIIAIAGPYLPKILGMEAAAVAGLPQGTMQPAQPTEEDVMELPVDVQERLGKVVETFMEATPEWLEILEKMAAKVKANPSVLSTIKMFL